MNIENGGFNNDGLQSKLTSIMIMPVSWLFRHIYCFDDLSFSFGGKGSYSLISIYFLGILPFSFFSSFSPSFRISFCSFPHLSSPFFFIPRNYWFFVCLFFFCDCLFNKHVRSSLPSDFFLRSFHAFINHLLSAIEMDAHHNKIIPFHISYQPYPLKLPVIWNNVPFSSWSKRFLSLTDSSEWPLMSSIE